MRAEVIVKERGAGMAQARNGLPRWAEATFAIAGLLVAAPVIALTGLGIAVFSGWPVFFRQQRVGQHGETFNLYKLRTMTPSAGGPQITSNGDSRITRLGRFLRHTKLDELPTLWNVVRGDMSLVGPRPEVPRFVQLADPIWQKVLAVRPGITDPVTLRLRMESELLAQIEGDTEEYYAKELQPAKLRGYVAYLEVRTWGTDLKVLLQTLAAVVVPRESTGLSVDGSTRLKDESGEDRKL
ncbi:MAG TPA: sugar transferase [Pyrinomonadaceae bacterium]|nr:sugar transferase [Pyrinomonadaceae bacterium]